MKTVSGEEFIVPLFDPLVARHFGAESSCIPHLIKDVDTNEIYAPLFKGRSDLVFLDIGANIGLVSIYASPVCNLIVAVEPSPNVFAVLKCMTLKVPNIECFQAALAEEDGPTEFFVNDVNTTASSTVNTYGEMIEVPGFTLTSILSIHQLEHVDVCKIDIEGAESQITPEQFVAAKDVIDCYWIEFHNIPRKAWEDSMVGVSDLLGLIGYGCREIDGMRLLARKA